MTVSEHEEMRIVVVMADFGGFCRPNVRDSDFILIVKVSISSEPDLTCEVGETV